MWLASVDTSLAQAICHSNWESVSWGAAKNSAVPLFPACSVARPEVSTRLPKLFCCCLPGFSERDFGRCLCNPSFHDPTEAALQFLPLSEMITGRTTPVSESSGLPWCPSQAFVLHVLVVKLALDLGHTGSHSVAAKLFKQHLQAARILLQLDLFAPNFSDFRLESSLFRECHLVLYLLGAWWLTPRLGLSSLYLYSLQPVLMSSSSAGAALSLLPRYIKSGVS